MEMCFHGNQLSWAIKHPVISLCLKYHSPGFICFPLILAPVISSLDEIYCMLIFYNNRSQAFDIPLCRHQLKLTPTKIFIARVVNWQIYRKKTTNVHRQMLDISPSEPGIGFERQSEYSSGFWGRGRRPRVFEGAAAV